MSATINRNPTSTDVGSCPGCSQFTACMDELNVLWEGDEPTALVCPNCASVLDRL